MWLRIYEFIIKALSILLLLYLTFSGFATPCYALSGSFILSCNLYQIISARKNFFLFLIMLFVTYCNYSVIYANYIYPVDSYYINTLAGNVVHKSLNILAIFTAITLWLVKWSKVYTDKGFSLYPNCRVKTFLLYGLLFALVIIMIFGFSRPTEVGERGSPSSLYEYALCFFVVYFYFAGTRRRFVIAGEILIVLYSLQNFVFGGRILGIQFLLLLYLTEFKERIPKRIFYSLMAGMFILMSMIGVARASILSGQFDIYSMLDNMLHSGFALDTAYSAFFTSETYIYTSDIIPLSDRLYQFMFFIKSIFIGFGNDIDKFPSYITTQYVPNGGGSFIPHFFFYYLEYVGIILGGVLFSIYMNIIRKPLVYKNIYVRIIIIFVVSTVFRWYLYSPLELLRGVLLLSLLMYVCQIFNRCRL